MGPWSFHTHPALKPRRPAAIPLIPLPLSLLLTNVPYLWYPFACYLEQTSLTATPRLLLSPFPPISCALFISLAALFTAPVLCFQQLRDSFCKTPGVAYPFANSSVAPKRKNASL